MREIDHSFNGLHCIVGIPAQGYFR